LRGLETKEARPRKPQQHIVYVRRRRTGCEGFGPKTLLPRCGEKRRGVTLRYTRQPEKLHFVADARRGLGVI